jgi:transcription initiation factor IIE alpha subunit
MIRKTSIETYNKIVNNGMIPKKRMEVYKALYEYGSMTSSELFQLKGWKTNQSGRFTELQETGVIQEIGTRACKVTGNKAIVWCTTDNLPISRPKVKTKAMKKTECLKYIADIGREIKKGTLNNEEILANFRQVYNFVESL